MTKRRIGKKILGLKSLFSKRSDPGQKEELEFLKERVAFLESLVKEKNISVENAKNNFLRNLYHEIRTPLNAIIGFSDLIEINHISEKDRQNYLKHIKESSRDFLRKMDNLIEASIIEAGLLKIELEECRVYDLLTELHTYFSLHKHIAEKNVALLLSVPDEMRSLKINCDAYRITQVISNMLSNSFKYTTRGIIEFGCKIVDRELEFFVRDTGTGGLEGNEDRIFQNFSKLDESDNAKEGLGLGLGLCKNIVETMGGRIWFKSSKGKGTTFYFTVPYKAIAVRKAQPELDAHQKVITLGRVFRRSVVF
jgi:signal transduction histidine kinase